MVALAVASLAISGIGSYMDYKSGKAQEKAREDAAAYNNALAVAGNKVRVEDIAASKEQAKQKASDEMRDTAVLFLKERAAALAGAAEAGVAGGSVTRTLVDNLMREGDLKGRQKNNLDFFIEDADRNIRAAQLGLAGQIQSYQGISSSTLAFSSLADFAADSLKIGSDAGWFGETTTSP